VHRHCPRRKDGRFIGRSNRSITRSFNSNYPRAWRFAVLFFSSSCARKRASRRRAKRSSGCYWMLVVIFISVYKLLYDEIVEWQIRGATDDKLWDMRITSCVRAQRFSMLFFPSGSRIRALREKTWNGDCFLVTIFTSVGFFWQSHKINIKEEKLHGVHDESSRRLLFQFHVFLHFFVET